MTAYSVYVSPAGLKLNVPPAPGSSLSSAGYPYSATLSAQVLFTDGSTGSTVTWGVGGANAGIATISADGVLSVLGSGSGSGPWTITVDAVAVDGAATGSRDVTVDDSGDAAVSVD